MKFTLAFAAFAAAVYGQTIDDIPACAQPCIQNAIASATTCAAADYACACSDANFANVESASINCVVAACGADEAINVVLPAVQAFCATQ
ncbi:uncharacterized protein Triagg1_3226 [Trichoderma aggressivum f. europaeum]|uniref:CFEM domain-containing protein n=1 Tax=Trichoderma aggressivum f. europaeum TaxID=173218 RepID=A0AAE1IHG0_9HYPO|nr:hypothetical protein Triagg1_3226 [Trichoderma aggressivum f. europaeum]